MHMYINTLQFNDLQISYLIYFIYFELSNKAAFIVKIIDVQSFFGTLN